MSDVPFPDIAQQIDKTGLEMGAIKLDPTHPFTWASGFQMPIYNDNRKLLADAKTRGLIAEGFSKLMPQLSPPPQVIAGIATAGIPHATTLADRLQKPLVYVRAEAKGHGLGNRIEGLLADGAQVLLIEDVISTGKSSLSAVRAVREAGGKVSDCFAIFNYGFNEALGAFEAEECALTALFDYDFLVAFALKEKRISSSEHELLLGWRSDPFGWGEKHGFPPKR